MLTCPKCGELNGNDRSRCFKCGSDLHGTIQQAASSATSGNKANRICPRCKKVFYGVTYTECPNCHIPMALYSLEAKLAAEGKNENYKPQQVPYAPPKKADPAEPKSIKTSFERMYEELGLGGYDNGTIELFKQVDSFFSYEKVVPGPFSYIPSSESMETNIEELVDLQISDYWFKMILVRQNQIIIDLLMDLLRKKKEERSDEEVNDNNAVIQIIP